jgi:hypothetical protein
MADTKWINEVKIRRLIKFNGSCCQSCHEDMDDYGYYGCSIDFGKDRETECCCAISVAYDEWLKAKSPVDSVGGEQ